MKGQRKESVLEVSEVNALLDVVENSTATHLRRVSQRPPAAYGAKVWGPPPVLLSGRRPSLSCAIHVKGTKSTPAKSKGLTKSEHWAARHLDGRQIANEKHIYQCQKKAETVLRLHPNLKKGGFHSDGTRNWAMAVARFQKSVREAGSSANKKGLALCRTWKSCTIHKFRTFMVSRSIIASVRVNLRNFTSN